MADKKKIWLKLSSFQNFFANYSNQDLKQDLVAGLTVAVMGVPQAMAYALIAGLSPIYGLYTAIFTCIISAILGSSNHLVTGPTNALCMVILSLCGHLPQKYGVGLFEIVLLVTIMTGFIQLLFGLLKMGGIIRYVSNSVVIGFTAGAGILIATNQLKNIFGISLEGTHAESFKEVLFSTFSRIEQINIFTLIVGLVAIFTVIVLPKLNKKLPASLLAVVLSTLLCFAFGWYQKEKMGAKKVEIVADISKIERNLNAFHVPKLVKKPNFALSRELGAGAIALALLGLIEAASIARAVAASSGQRLNFNREFLGQGLGNLFGGFFSCFAGSGSFTRTAICYKSGGRTRIAAIFSAMWTALTVLLLAPFANYIPKASLAGILIVIAYTMVEKERLQLTWKSGFNSRMVFLGTLLSTLVLPLEYAIFIGVFLSVVLLLRVTSKTDLTQLVPLPDSGFEEVPFNRASPSEVVTINMEGDLYFAAVEDLDYELLRCFTSKTKVVVLRMKRLRAVGSTAIAILKHFWQLCLERNISLVVCGIEKELNSLLVKSGLHDQIGENNIFYADNKLLQSTELATARAFSIVKLLKKAKQKLDGPKHGDSLLELQARDVLSRRCIRFGNEHPLREALWLMSELHKHSPSHTPQPLFLQNNEAKLFGKLSTRKILYEMSSGLDESELVSASEEQLAKLLRKSFPKVIKNIARQDLTPLGPDATIGELLRVAVKDELQVIPVCDEHGRLMGLVEQYSLLKIIEKFIKNGKSD